MFKMSEIRNRTYQNGVLHDSKAFRLAHSKHRKGPMLRPFGKGEDPDFSALSSKVLPTPIAVVGVVEPVQSADPVNPELPIRIYVPQTCLKRKRPHFGQENGLRKQLYLEFWKRN